jgi:hypothetical protein
MRWPGHVSRMGTGEVHREFWWVDMMEGDHLDDLGGDGFTSRMGAWGRFGLAQYREMWRALVNAVMIFRVPQNGEIS